MVKILSNKDDEGYNGRDWGDSGCKYATKAFSRQSSCLRCTFEQCHMDKIETRIGVPSKGQRNKEIRLVLKGELTRALKSHKNQEEVAKEFNISVRTVRRIVNGK